MKIGLVCPYDCTWPGGVLAHISHLARQFTLWGHDVKILAPFTPSRTESEEGNFIPMGRSVPVPYGGSIARISLSVWLYSHMRNLLDQEQFDIVHVHEPLAPVLPLLALQHSRAINVGTFHACYSSPRRYRLTHPFLKRWFNKLNGRIAIGEHVSQQMGRFFPADYTVIPNGIDIEQFSNNVEPFPEFMDGKINILFVGRLEKRKGLKYLLEAYAQLRWEFRNLRLIVVGPGDVDSECWRVISERNITDVVFTGKVSSNDLPRYYQSADAFCAPATGRESFGIVLLEAMAAGKPIVATRIQGYSAVVKHEQQALMVPPEDSSALADALAILIRDADLRRQMGTIGQTAVENYRWEAIAGRVMDYYQTLISDKNGIARER